MNYTERNRLIDRLCGVGLMLIFVELFLVFATDGLKGSLGMLFVSKVPTILNILGAIFLLIGICVLIYSYKKENGWRAVYGIEFLALACVAVILPHAYIDFHAPFNKLGKIFPFVFLAYYIGKIIYVVLKANKKKR